MEAPEKLKIAILDDYIHASPPYFERFKTAGHDVVYFPDTLLPYHHPDTPQSMKDDLVKRLEPFHVINAFRERTALTAELLRRLPNLRVILTQGRRNSSIDLDVCRERGIPVFTLPIPTPNRPKAVDSTTEHIVTLVLGLARNIAEDDASLKAGRWQTQSIVALSGKTLGIVGLGHLGSKVARIFHVAFGMEIVAWSQNLTQDKADEQAQAAGLPVEDADGNKTFRVVSRDELFRSADVVSVHLFLSERSRGLITSEDLNKMKPRAFFVNTSRGPLVVEEDLLAVLRAGRIKGAALDVFNIEPLPADSPWRNPDWGKNGTSHVLLTPHTAFTDGDAIDSWYREQATILDGWMAGKASGQRLA